MRRKDRLRGREENPHSWGTQKSDKLWRSAIMLAVHRTAQDGKRKRLDLLAERLVQCGMAGDVGALKEIGDRLDGKPKQEIGGENGGPLDVRVVVKTIEPPPDRD